MQDGNAMSAGNTMSHSMRTRISLLKAETRMTVVALVCLVLCGGCSFAPKYAKPVVQTPAAYKELPPEQFNEVEGWKAAEPKDGMIRGKWWEIFNESELNAFEGQVANSNQSVAVALANFLAARAVVKQARSQYFPTVTASPSVTRARQSSVVTQSSSSPTPFTVTEYSLPFDASWELDFWGRIRNSVKASSFEAQATLADLENVRLTVQAEVAADYFQLRVLDAQKELLDAAVLAYQDSLKLTQVQSDTGMASGQDVAQAETQLNTTRAQATDLGIQRAQLEHAIATLLGTPASSFSIATNSLAATPVAIPFGVPSQLLERRPDVAAAERRVAEANAQIGVARAAYYPTITLSGSAGYQSASLGNLVSAQGLAWSVGATLAQTLFDGGKRKAVTEQARAIYQGTVANYRQTVLTAFQEVEDNLSALRILSEELQQQNAAVESSQRYLTLADARYKSGLDIYLDVIIAQTALLSNQRTAMNLRMQQMTASVQLIKALGGGWDVSHSTTAAIP
jgi:NodT family efflux transporter outer membrane factor (OMF) lipoprotein